VRSIDRPHPFSQAPARALLVLVLVAGLLGVAAVGAHDAAAARQNGGQPGSGGGSQPKAVPNSTLKIKPHGLRKGRAGITSIVTVGGSLSPYRKGQRVQVYFFHNAKRFSLRRVRVKKGKGNYGTFRTRVAT
jgi:hypothetical protein